MLTIDALGESFDPVQLDSGVDTRIKRDASLFDIGEDYLRAARRSHRAPAEREATYGFRCARTL